GGQSGQKKDRPSEAEARWENKFLDARKKRVSGRPCDSDQRNRIRRCRGIFGFCFHGLWFGLECCCKVEGANSVESERASRRRTFVWQFGAMPSVTIPIIICRLSFDRQKLAGLPQCS